MEVYLENFTVDNCNYSSNDYIGYGNINKTELYVSECLEKECITLDECRNVIKEYVQPTAYEWVMIVIYSVILVVGLLGNGLVCFVVFRNSNMRTVVNIFIVNLAVADFLVLLVCLPPSVLADTTETWWLGSAMCKVVPFLQTVSVSVSVLTLGAISIERYFAICHPLRRRLTPPTVSLIIVAIWATAVAVAVPELIYQTLEQAYPFISDYLTYCTMALQPHNQKYYQIFLMIGLYAVPMCLMFFAYSTIAVRLWKDTFSENANCRVNSGNSRMNSANSRMNSGSSVGRRAQFSATRPDNQLNARRKAAKMLMTIVVLFAVCYLPVHLLNILKYSGTLHVWALWCPEVVVAMALTARGLCYFNSALNPVIYNFMSAKFRQEFKTAFSRCHDRFQEPVKTPMKLYNFRATRTNGHTRSERYSMNTYTSRNHWNGNVTPQSSSSKRSPC